MALSVADRFESKVERIPEHLCWEWSAARDKRTGYGWFSIRDGMRRAHRVAWELAYGEVPEGMHVLHRCDNPGCVRPDHLFLGTHQDNVADCRAKDRHARGERHPSHKLTDDDVRTIRALYAAGVVSQQTLAERFGVSKMHIRNILRRKKWSHLR